MAFDVSQATLENVFRISIGKLRVLHNVSQPNANTTMFRAVNEKHSTVQQSTTGQSRTPRVPSAANRLLRSLLITRLARKARSQLMLQQAQARMCAESSVTVPETVSVPTSSEQSVVEVMETGLDESCTGSVVSNSTQYGKRRNPCDADTAQCTQSKHKCTRTELSSTSTPEKKPTHELNHADATGKEPSSAPTLRRNYWECDSTLSNMPLANRSSASANIAKQVVSPRVVPTVTRMTVSSENADACHRQPSSTAPHLTTLPCHLLSGVS